MKSIFNRDESEKSPRLKRENARDCWPGVRKVLGAKADENSKNDIPDPSATPDVLPREQKKDSNAGLQVDQKTDPAVGQSMNED